MIRISGSSGRASFALSLFLAVVVVVGGGNVALCDQPAPDSGPVERRYDTSDEQTPQPDENADGDSDADQAAPGLSGESDDVEIPSAVVIGVTGEAEWAPAGVSVLEDEGWASIELDQTLSPGTQIRTGFRSQVNLRFGQATFVSIRSASFAGIAEFYLTETSETVRIELGYGTVRGGSTEGEVRSDVVVDSPQATLAKRGTDGWQVTVEAGTGRFHISLARHGLIEAIRKLTGDRSRSKLVRPGEYATVDNIANLWIDQAIFDRNVSFCVVEALTTADSGFAADNTDGLGVVVPGAGNATADLTGRTDSEWTMAQIAANFPTVQSPQASGQPQPPSTVVFLPIRRAEGNFGTPEAYRERTVIRTQMRRRP